MLSIWNSLKFCHLVDLKNNRLDHEAKFDLQKLTNGKVSTNVSLREPLYLVHSSVIRNKRAEMALKRSPE